MTYIIPIGLEVKVTESEEAIYVKDLTADILLRLLKY